MSAGVKRARAERAKCGVGGEEVFVGAAEIGEVGAAATGDENLLADAVCVVDEKHTAVALAGLCRTHQPGRTGTQHDHIPSLHACLRRAEAGVLYFRAARVCAEVLRGLLAFARARRATMEAWLQQHPFLLFVLVNLIRRARRRH